MSNEPKAPFANCAECTLRDKPFVPSYMPEDAEIAIIGEGPGANEVKQGKPFVGMSGKLLEARFKHEGIDYEKVWRSNVVCCRPPGNRAPTRLEAKCCMPRLKHELSSTYSRSTVITLGKEAADAYLPETADYKVSERRGHWFEKDGYNVLPTWHPAYVLRRPSEAKNMFDDMHSAIHGTPQHFLQNAPKWVGIFQLEQLEAMVRAIPPQALLAWDLETDQVMWYDRAVEPADKILMMGLTWTKDEAYIIHPDLIYSVEGRKVLGKMFARQDVEFIAHNGKFDVIFLRSVGVTNARCDFDTMLAHYALWEETGYHGLKQLALTYFGLADYEQNLVQTYLKSRNDRYSKVPYGDLALYCAWDCCVTRELRNVFALEMAKDDVDDMFRNILMPMQEALTEVEMNGVPIDKEYVEMWYERMLDYCDRLEDEMQRIADDPEFNPRSYLQVGHVIYEKRKLPRPRVRGVAPNSTAKKALMHIKPGQDEFVDTLRTYRRAHKLNKTYNANLLLYQDLNGRVHPNALIHGTEVGRLSFRNPAIQTIPRPYEDMYGAMVRSAFVAPEGWKFILADYSQAELRVAAILSNEPFLLKVYQEGRDLHSEVALAMYGPDFTRAHRVICKMFNFSYLYGGSEYSFAEDAGLPIAIAREFVHNYNKLMPRLAEWKMEQFQQLKTRGWVQSYFGRKRRCLLVTQNNVNDVRKSAGHMPVASVASDLTQLSLIEAISRGHHVVLTVHDSIGELAPEDEADKYARELAQIMEETAAYHFPQLPWKVDAEVRDRWAPVPEEIHGEEFRATFG